MTRSMSFGPEGYPQHVMIRGIAGEPFFQVDDDYRHYLELLTEISVERGCAVHAYVLMDKHVRMLLTTQPDFGINWIMEDLNQRYVKYKGSKPQRDESSAGTNYRVGAVGSASQFFTCCRYVEQTPVRAGLAEHTAKYRWSSFLHNAMGWPDPAVRPHELYLRLGATSSERQQKYRGLFRRPLNNGRLNKIRLALKPASLGYKVVNKP